MSLLDDLLLAKTQDQYFDQVIQPALQAAKVRITDWLTGGFSRTMAKVTALFGSEAQTMVASVLAGSFETYAFGDVPAPNGIDASGWAPVIAKNRYGVDQIEASSTRRLIHLANSSGSNYGPLVPGSLTILFTATGNRYILDGTASDQTASITIPASGSVDAAFRSEFAVDSASGRTYDDSSSATIILITSQFPGVVATNPAPTFDTVTQSGSGVGLVTPTGSPVGSYVVTVKITATGTVAGSTVGWEWSLTGVDGSFVVGVGSSVVNAGGSGITLTLTDNLGSPAFVAGTLYFIRTPGSDVISLGRDADTPPEIGVRCRGLIPLIGFPKDPTGIILPLSPVFNAWEALVRAMNDQIVTVLVSRSTTINNRIDIIIAGQGAVLPSDVISSVQAGLSALGMLTDDPVVQSPTPRPISIKAASTTTIYVKASQLVSAQRALQNAFASYFGGTDQGSPLGVNGLILRARLVAMISDTPGVTKTDADTTLQIGHNGGSYAATNLQLPITGGTFEIASWTGEDVASRFVWVAV